MNITDTSIATVLKQTPKNASALSDSHSCLAVSLVSSTIIQVERTYFLKTKFINNYFIYLLGFIKYKKFKKIFLLDKIKFKRKYVMIMRFELPKLLSLYLKCFSDCSKELSSFMHDDKLANNKESNDD